eukprot:Hpha_TRINITY_DN36301_c0_g1::TRINITY_DN36301_c0_g1_i1::g.86372::m.86372/K10869/RAD51L1, RAD51B; RAD51-like protein 1
MGNRRVEAFDLGAGVTQSLISRNHRTALDVLLSTAQELAILLDAPVSEAVQLQLKVARCIAPRPQPLLVLAGSFVPTGLPSLDSALCGGLPAGLVVEAAGAPGCGKTQLCLTTAALCAASAPVIYVDTEGKFAADRLAEIIATRNFPPTTIENLQLLRLQTAAQLKDLPSELELRLHETGARLVLIDSVAALLRPEDMSTMDLSDFVARFASRMKEVAVRFGAAVLVTNHVTVAGAAGRGDGAALGNTWHHSVNVRLTLRTEAAISHTATCRELIVSKNPLGPNARFFYRVAAQGLVEDQ